MLGTVLQPGCFVTPNLLQGLVQLHQSPADVSDQGQGVVVMGGILQVGIEVDDPLHIRVAGARAVRLADGARPDRDQQVSVFHGVITGQGALRTTHAHVLRVVVGNTAGRDGRMYQHPTGTLEQAGQLEAGVSSSTADLDNDPLCLPDPLRGQPIIHFRRAQRDMAGFRQFIQVEAREPGGLGVHRHQQVKRAGPGGMVHGRSAALQGGRQRQRSVQGIGPAHFGSQLQEQTLFVFRHLLHVEALILGGLVAEKIPDTDAIRGGHQRSGQGLQRTRPNRSDHGGFFASDPAQGSGGMRGFDLAAQPVDPDQPGLLVDA